MAKITTARKTAKTISDIIRLTTGKKPSQILAKGVELFAQELAERTSSKLAEKYDPPDPLQKEYDLLGIHAGAPVFLVKGAYRAWARELHPDTGTKPDTEKFGAMTKAYNKIMESKSASKKNA